MKIYLGSTLATSRPRRDLITLAILSLCSLVVMRERQSIPRVTDEFLWKFNSSACSIKSSLLPTDALLDTEMRALCDFLCDLWSCMRDVALIGLKKSAVISPVKHAGLAERLGPEYTLQRT